MSAFLVSPEAEDDLKTIWRYLLGEADLATANRIQNELLESFEGLAAHTGMGHKRPDLTRRDVLFKTLYQYMIVYRRTAAVEIVGVLHGKRNLKRILNVRLADNP